MAESPVYGLLHAYALGCLNKQDFSDLKKYFRSGQSFEWAELGEYQNLSAMLPAILNIDSPPPQLKDKVARRLYRIRDQRRKTLIDLHKITQLSTPDDYEAAKAKLTPLPTPVAAPAPAPVIPPVDEKPPVIQDKGFARVTQERVFNLDSSLPGISENDLKGIMAQNEQAGKKYDPYQTQFELDASAINNWQEPELPVPEEIKTAPHKVTKEELPKPPAHVEKPAPPKVKMTEEKPAPPAQNPILERLGGGDFDTSNNEPAEGKSRKGIWAAIIIIFLLLAAIAAGGYYLFMQNMKNTKEIEKIRQQMNAQTMKADANSEILAMMNSREFKVAELKPAKDNLNCYGRIYMNFDLKTAYFQFAELPDLSAGKTYCLWADISGSLISLGEFTPKASINYQPLPKLPVIDKDLTVSFMLTEEKAEGAKNPSNKVFLSGKI